MYDVNVNVRWGAIKLADDDFQTAQDLFYNLGLCLTVRRHDLPLARQWFSAEIRKNDFYDNTFLAEIFASKLNVTLICK